MVSSQSQLIILQRMDFAKFAMSKPSCGYSFAAAVDSKSSQIDHGLKSYFGY
jgi:hypothetical protein